MGIAVIIDRLLEKQLNLFLMDSLLFLVELAELGAVVLEVLDFLAELGDDVLELLFLFYDDDKLLFKFSNLILYFSRLSPLK